VRAGDFIFVSGQVAKDAERQHDLRHDRGRDAGTIESISAFSRRRRDAADVVRVTTYLEDTRDFGRYNKVFAEHFKDAVLARTTVEARAVISTRIEMEAIASCPRRVTRAQP
jgi:enamine deaminase RidA (YjgF/YER057c/UK114 family)